ncbi:MAG TPA: 3-hydroxyacyl-CoA dehydrogenase NAD-binding domain-containing protein [Polyangiaceae bacterium]|nr:3-hydroxyacyl-CoA dehydrogenase NAD-binding domain-containing protein [Polyangiaceae bacterium]
MSQTVIFEKRGPIGIINVDNPPVNALSRAVRQGLLEALAQANAAGDVKAVVLACRGRTFIAGADITEFGMAPQGPDLGAVIAAYEASAKPVVAAIHGTALGGGLEVALGCHYRVALATAKLGLPEVKLGLLPGAGGTQRLPRLVGFEKAIAMITSGEPILAPEAKALALVDEIVDGDLTDAGVRFAERVAGARPLPRARDRQDHVDAARKNSQLFDQAKKDVTQRARGAGAPLRCLEAIRAALELPFDQGLARERQLFAEAVSSAESAALRHVFFAERMAAKIPDVPADTPAATIRSAVVIGAGTMGGGITMALVNAGISVTLIDREPAFVDKGMEVIKKNYGSTVKKGRLAPSEMDARLARITPASSWDALSKVDLVIEAVFEEMELKKEVFGRLDAACRPDAILATNTSSLDVDAIAAVTSRPEQVIGLHFFSPANVMRLLEIVRGKKTSREVIATSMKLAKQIGKVGVLVGVCDGFVGNRMLHKYAHEAQHLLLEGALPQQVDRVITAFGFAMGPMATSDLAGIDVGWRIRKARPKPGPSDRYGWGVADRLAEMGHYGQKTGAGFYKYEDGSRVPIPNPEVEKIIVEIAQSKGIERRSISDQEILERCLFSMINEGARILEEKIALRASDIDTVWINGYGFPAHRGGPMFYADAVGLSKILATVKAFREKHDEAWEPAPLLVRLASEQKTFASLDEHAG